MKIKKKYSGMLPRLSHAPAEYAVRGVPMAVFAACRADGDEVPDHLLLYVRDGGKYVMTPSDSFTDAGLSYEIYRADVPAEEVRGERLIYAVAAEGLLSEMTEYVTVPLIGREELPELPPLCVTELYIRPKGPGIGVYYEVMNPSDRDVDLYDYQVLVYTDTTAEGDISGCPLLGRLPMADAPGEILHSGEYAAIWPLRGKNFANNGRDYTTPQDFCDVFNAEYFNTEAGFTPEDGRIVPVNYTFVDPATGKRKKIPGVCDIPEKHHISTLLIVPRDAGPEKAVYRITYSTEYAQWDTPVKRSSYWKIDVRDPRVGVNICHRAPATPGYPGRGQSVPDPMAALPVIVPMFPDGEVYIGDGDCRVSFGAVPGEACRPVTDADVHVLLPEGGELKLSAFETASGAWEASVPGYVVEKLSKLEYYITASDGTRAVACGEKEHFEVPVLDNAAPRITEMLPTEGYAYDGTGEIAIRASWQDISGVRTGECSLELDGKNLTAKAAWTDSGVEYLPVKRLSFGEHKLRLTLCDNLGNTRTETVTFTVSDMTELSVYRGEVHAHTADSDGTGFPADALRYARDVGGVDYFAVTDHSHYVTPELYDAQQRTADGFDEPGKFAALYGWEMTWNNNCGYWGHMNILNTRPIVQNIKKNSLPDMYAWLEKHPEAVAMFNHPGLTWGNFDEYAHWSADADRAVCLSEIRGAAYDREYAHMLSRGWHAAPVANEDNHLPNWTTATTTDGCVLAPALTRQNIIDAFRARRTYTTSDPTLKILYKVNGRWLGSRLDAPEKLEFELGISTENEYGIGLIEIVAEDNVVVASKNVGARRSFEWKFTLAPDFDYYYVRVTCRRLYAVTAPVWIENRPAPEIRTMEYAASYSDKEPAAITLSVFNTAEETMSDVRVSFYLTDAPGFHLALTEPYCTVCAGKIKAGGAVKVSRLLPELSGLRRVSVLVRAKLGSASVCAARYILISPVTITEVTPDTGAWTAPSGAVVSNPFPYATLCNSSPREVSLKGGKLSLWDTTGKQPSEDHVWPTDGITIPPRSAVVVWDRSASDELTAEDFNARYGTALTEGKDLFLCDKPISSDSVDGRRLDLSVDGELMSRVHWNFTDGHDGVRHTDKAHRYVYRPNMTGTSEPDGIEAPAPGTVSEEQLRRQFTVLPRRAETKLAKKTAARDEKQDKRHEKLKMTKNEAAFTAAGAAAVAAAAATAVSVLIGKKKS